MTRLEKLNYLFELLRKQGRVHTKGDLADLIGCNRASLSQAFSDKNGYLNDKLLRRIGDVAGLPNVDFDEHPLEDVAPDNMYDKLDKLSMSINTLINTNNALLEQQKLLIDTLSSMMRENAAERAKNADLLKLLVGLSAKYTNPRNNNE